MFRAVSVSGIVDFLLHDMDLHRLGARRATIKALPSPHHPPSPLRVGFFLHGMESLFVIEFDKLLLWYDSLGKMNKKLLCLIRLICIQLEEENESLLIL